MNFSHFVICANPLSFLFWKIRSSKKQKSHLALFVHQAQSSTYVKKYLISSDDVSSILLKLNCFNTHSTRISLQMQSVIGSESSHIYQTSKMLSLIIFKVVFFSHQRVILEVWGAYKCITCRKGCCVSWILKSLKLFQSLIQISQRKCSKKTWCQMTLSWRSCCLAAVSFMYNFQISFLFMF